MKLIKREEISCPHCHTTQLQVSALNCSSCDIEVRVKVEENEFSKLSEEQLHFLRVFIHCEGKIKDIEKALGLSYPTVKNKMHELKAQLASEYIQTQETPKTINEILDQMKSGQLSYEEGLKQLKDKN